MRDLYVGNRKASLIIILLSIALECHCLALSNVSQKNSRAVCPWPSLDVASTSPAADPPEGYGNYGDDEPDSPITVNKRKKRAGGLLSGPVAVGKPIAIGVPVPPSIPTFQETVAAGRQLWSRLQDVLQTPDSKFLPAPCLDIEKRWRLTSFSTIRRIADIWWTLFPQFSDPAARPTHGPSWYLTNVHAPRDDAIRFYYANLYSPALGTIIAESIKGKPMPGQFFWDEPKVAPDRWSDVTWAYWNRVCAATSTDPSTLTHILQQAIKNDHTQSIMRHLLGDEQQYRVPINGGNHYMLNRRLTPADDGDDFLALLRTPNVVGSVHLLMQYVKELGKKTIKSITIVRLFDFANWSGVFYLAVEFEEFAAAGAAGAAGGEDRGQQDGAGLAQVETS